MTQELEKGTILSHNYNKKFSLYFLVNEQGLVAFPLMTNSPHQKQIIFPPLSMPSVGFNVL